MSTATKKAPLHLKQEEKEELKKLSQSKKAAAREVQRAKILLEYSRSHSIEKARAKGQTTRNTVYKCINKALSMGYKAGLKDTYHRPKKPKITEESKAWVIHIACTKPKELGFAAELWTQRALAVYVREHSTRAQHPCLNQAGKATINRILKSHSLKPHKIKYYLECRDPEFESKMKTVLMVYKEVEIQNKLTEEKRAIYSVCVDEKPGVQAIENTAPDLAPKAGKYSCIGRDYEYKRHGTASILAGIDLHNGHVFAEVERRHRSKEFIQLLKSIDAYYPKSAQIRLILDNHSSHISKETQAFLATRPSRFIYVHTPKHGSWLNLAETLFGKMARSFLKSIRVNSWDDLKQRILLGVSEINASPVVLRCKNFDPIIQLCFIETIY